MSRRVAALITVVLAVATDGCAEHRQAQRSTETDSPIPKLSFSFKSIHFKTGRPVHGEDALSSIRNLAGDDLKSLVDDATALKRVRNYRLKIIGFTDNVECSGDECVELSSRRAQVVYDWFIANGVPPDVLEPPVGEGLDPGIGDNRTEEGRQFNRRVEID